MTGSLLRIVTASLLAVTLASAQEGWADRLHRRLSTAWLAWSDRLDRSLAAWLGDKNATEPAGVDATTENDTFFQTGKFLSETPASYVRVRAIAALNSYEGGRQKIRLRAHLPLPRTTRRLKLFISGESERDTVAGRSGTDETRVGVRYGLPAWRNWHSRVSIGIGGWRPYLRGRVYRTYRGGVWRIEPVETAEVGIGGRWGERTDLYCDYPLEGGRLWRLRLMRGTQSDDDLPRFYGGAISYSVRAAKGQGWRIAGVVSASPDYGGDDGARYAGVYRYVGGAGYRLNVWRPWFFVETVAAVNFRRERRFRPDYGIGLMVDLFFGKQ
ncbi:MAG: hypothetical protein GXO33_04690 [Epsilonproteobacteria bacterium]|nr:hypothetical protein [Campylobacterota bacterium]